MIEIRIPAELETYWEQIVKERFGGDDEEAVLHAVVRLIEQERKDLVDAERFDQVLKKYQDRLHRADEISQDEFSSALAKRQRRMEKARQLFGELGKDSDEKK